MYVSPEHLPHMHKIVLQTPKNMSLRDLAARLAAETHEAMPPHYLWVEQPENVPTCLAIAPNRKPEVGVDANTVPYVHPKIMYITASLAAGIYWSKRWISRSKASTRIGISAM